MEIEKEKDGVPGQDFFSCQPVYFIVTLFFCQNYFM